MAGCDQWAFLKAFEVVLCIACLCYKWWTDEEASRLYFFLEKRSREWPLQKNITWNQAGSWFADVTFGGYVIITIGLFVSHFMGELRQTRKTESFLLGIGALLFFGAGCMVITSFDNVPESLVDNALILGVLAIFTGFVFVIDICCLRTRIQSNKVNNQEKEFRMGRDQVDSGHRNGLVVEKVAETETTQAKVISELRSSIKKKPDTLITESQHHVRSEQMQTHSHPQYGRKHLDNRGFEVGNKTRKVSSEPNNSYDYEVQSIKNYGDRLSVASTDSNETDSDYDATIKYNRKSRGSQTKRRHFVKEKTMTTVVERHVRDTATGMDSPRPIMKTTFLNGDIQSPKVTTTDPHKSDSPTSEEGYRLHSPVSASYHLSNENKFQSSIIPSRIEKLGHNSNGNIAPMPSSPQDPGYVLHTASKWPNATPLGPTPYQKWKETKHLKSVQSVV